MLTGSRLRVVALDCHKLGVAFDSISSTCVTCVTCVACVACDPLLVGSGAAGLSLKLRQMAVLLEPVNHLRDTATQFLEVGI